MRATRGPTVAWLSFTHLLLTWMFLSNYCSLIFLHCGNVVSHIGLEKQHLFYSQQSSAGEQARSLNSQQTGPYRPRGGGAPVSWDHPIHPSFWAEPIGVEGEGLHQLLGSEALMEKRARRGTLQVSRTFLGWELGNMDVQPQRWMLSGWNRWWTLFFMF